MTWGACIAYARSFAGSSSSSAAFAFAFALALACGDDAAPPAPPPVQAEPETIVLAETGVDDCEGLAISARDDADDAALLPVLCPHVSLDAVTARAVLMAAGSSREAQALVPALAKFPELQAMAQLVGHVAAPLPVPPTLVDPAKAAVTPIDANVLAQVQLARALLYDGKTPVDTRTRARAYLAKVHMSATRQLGIGATRPPGPFGRLLAAQAIHYGRSFCTSYWRRRVSGLFDIFAQTEVDLLSAVLALEASHYAADPAIVAIELGEGRQYVRRTATAARIRKRLESSPEATQVEPSRLAPTVNELDRLLAMGFVDAALSAGISIGTKSGGPGLAPMEQLLTEGLRRAEGEEYAERLARRFARARKREPRPAEHGPGELDHAREPPWPSATAEATRLLDALRDAPTTGFGRRRALGHAVLLGRRRPDALRAAIDEAARASDPKLAGALPLLRAVATELDDGNLRTLRRSHATDPDRLLRQQFAVTVREDGAQPR